MNKDHLNRVDADFLVVAHQIQAPLSAVKWTLSMLVNGDEGALTEGQLTLAKKAFSSNDRAIHLIEEVLSANRLQYGGEILSFSWIPIFDIIQNTISELSNTAKEKDIKIIISDFKGESPLVEVDREKIRDAFENVLENAIKYTPQGGKVTISVVREESDVLISVEDTGIGITEDDEYKIFNKFFRGSNAKLNGTSGTGLGLFIARGVVEKHGGKMWFEDKKRDLHMDESGVRFSFTVPLNRQGKVL